jgi:hypothetical protein
MCKVCFPRETSTAAHTGNDPVHAVQPFAARRDYRPPSTPSQRLKPTHTNPSLGSRQPFQPALRSPSVICAWYSDRRQGTRLRTDISNKEGWTLFQRRRRFLSPAELSERSRQPAIGVGITWRKADRLQSRVLFCGQACVTLDEVGAASNLAPAGVVESSGSFYSAFRLGLG